MDPVSWIRVCWTLGMDARDDQLPVNCWRKTLQIGAHERAPGAIECQTKWHDGSGVRSDTHGKCDASVAGFLEGQWRKKCRAVNGAQQTRSILKSCRQGSSYKVQAQLEIDRRHPACLLRTGATGINARAQLRLLLLRLLLIVTLTFRGVRVAGNPAY
jgi:hypothetical protein